MIFKGCIALHAACLNGHLPIVQYLIEKGANIEAKTNDQYTPLHFACLNSHLPTRIQVLKTASDFYEISAVKKKIALELKQGIHIAYKYGCFLLQ